MPPKGSCRKQRPAAPGSPPALLDLPQGVVENILSYIRLDDLPSLRLVSKALADRVDAVTVSGRVPSHRARHFFSAAAQTRRPSLRRVSVVDTDWGDDSIEGVVFSGAVSRSCGRWKTLDLKYAFADEALLLVSSARDAAKARRDRQRLLQDLLSACTSLEDLALPHFLGAKAQPLLLSSIGSQQLTRLLCAPGSPQDFASPKLRDCFRRLPQLTDLELVFDYQERRACIPCLGSLATRLPLLTTLIIDVKEQLTNWYVTINQSIIPFF